MMADTEKDDCTILDHDSNSLDSHRDITCIDGKSYRTCYLRNSSALAVNC